MNVMHHTWNAGSPCGGLSGASPRTPGIKRGRMHEGHACLERREPRFDKLSAALRGLSGSALLKHRVLCRQADILSARLAPDPEKNRQGMMYECHTYL